MPTVCIQRPNRTKQRRFTERDLARIAQTMERQGHPVIAIVATILVALGLGVLVCKASKAINNVLGILGIIKQIAALFASAALTKALLVWLQRLLRVPVPIPGWVQVITLLITFVLAIQALSKGAATLVSDVETVQDIAATLASWCEAITNRLGG